MTENGSGGTKTRRRHKVRGVVRIVSVGLLALAVAKELRKPSDEREWHGQMGFIPYDLRPPTPRRIRDSMWNPEEPRIITDRPFGVGWTLNAGRLYHLWRQRRAA